MKRRLCPLRLIGLVALFLNFTFAASAQNNSISGIVFDNVGRKPVSDVYVELMNELSVTLKRIRTDGSGRFYFSGLSAGNFKVKVLTLGTNYLEQTQDATIVNLARPGGFSSDNIYLEFRLQIDKRKINVGSPGAPGVVFAQNVPNEARKLYEKGVEQLSQKKDEGLDNLKKAIEIFPTYYDALNRLGVEYVQRKQYQTGVEYLIRAIDINQKSFSSYYALGVASYNLKEIKPAIEAMRAATILNPKSVDAQIWYGRVLRIDRSYKDAEKALLQAKSLSKDNPIAEINWQLALLYDKTGRYKEAADELEQFLKLQPDTRDAKQIKTLIAELRAKSK